MYKNRFMTRNDNTNTTTFVIDNVRAVWVRVRVRVRIRVRVRVRFRVRFRVRVRV